ncbi:MAG: hypothetical protein QOD94_887 [Alphaproteobacteria bacterium]|nr:hypothetical protein [Alphaproteobacteria bacterium]
MPDRMTLPGKDAFTGPIFNVTLAVISVSENFSRPSQPGIHCLKTLVVQSRPHDRLGSLNALGARDVHEGPAL